MNRDYENRPFDELWDLLSAVEIGAAEPGSGGLESEELPPESSVVNADGVEEITSVDLSDIKRVLTADEEKCMRERLYDIRKFASWNGEDAKQKLNSMMELFKEEFPGLEERMNAAIEEGKENRKLYKKAYKMGGSGASKEELDKLIDSVSPRLPKEVARQVVRNYKLGRNAHNRFKAERKRKNVGGKLSAVTVRPLQKKAGVYKFEIESASKRKGTPAPMNVDGIHPNDIRMLSPGDAWALVIDETGDTFDETIESVKKRRVGRLVGVLVPEHKPAALPPLSPGWHAVDCVDPEEIDGVMQAVLDGPVGVFGLNVRTLPTTFGERWMDAVALLIDWTLRLMPVDRPCRLSVKIEQRGVFAAKQPWDLVRRECLRRLALAYPKRAARIRLEIDVIRKDDSPLNGYVDSVAFTWAQTNDSSKARLKQSGLEGTCLLGGPGSIDARTMLNAWDAFAQGVHLPSAQWWTMVSSREARNPGALVTTLLARVGEEAKAAVAVWQGFVGEIKARMADSPVDLQKLSVAIDWLQQYQPENVALLPAMRLVWLTVNLARMNHEGRSKNDSQVEGWLKELNRLGNRLFDEAAPLVCHADLHRAVEATNLFEFDAASDALARWRDCQPAIPGLRYWGQVRSSLGQHAAFVGDNAEAVKYFWDAIAAFERLSDPAEKASNTSQTACYLAIAMMDDADVPDAEVNTALERVIGPLAEAAKRLAASENDDRYGQHLLLRWLVHRGDAALAKQYLELCEQWYVGAGHPWPLIQLYRAILLRDTEPEKAVEYALNGAEIAFETHQGPVVRLIGSCCRVVASGWGMPWPEGTDELHLLKEALPVAGQRVESLQASLEQPVAPLTLLRDVLPFNYR